MYHTREQFLDDVELVVVNSQKYNGVDSAFTQTAHLIMQIARDAINEVLSLINTINKVASFMAFLNSIEDVKILDVQVFFNL